MTTFDPRYRPATLLVQVPSLRGGPALTLRGPGIDGSSSATIDGLPPSQLEARIVELKNAYAHAREIRSTLPGGIVSVRPPPGGPGDQFVGSFKFSGRGDVPVAMTR